MAFPFFGYIAIASYSLPVLLGGFFWKRLVRDQRIFFFFCIYSLLHVLVEHLMMRNSISNQSLANYFQLIETVCLMYLFSRKVSDTIVRDTILAAGSFYIVFWTYEMTFYETPDQFSEFLIIVASMLLIVVPIMMLTGLFKRSENLLSELSAFWIGSGILVYSAGSLALLSMSNVIMEMGIVHFNRLWYINFSLVIVLNIFYARSFKCATF